MSTDARSLTVTVNGRPRTVDVGSTVGDLVREVAAAAAVAVERNGDVVPASEHGSTPLADGDRLEIVTFVGGG